MREMLLKFTDPSKLKTKRIIYENVFHARDSATLEQLKELSSNRRLIEESINDKSLLTEAIAREMSGGLTSRVQQDLRKLDFYLPILENLVLYVESHNSPTIRKWVSDIGIQWSSAMKESSGLFGGCKYFRVNDLHFELGMCTYLYGALLRDSAFEIQSEDLVESTTLHRKAAGVFEYLANVVLVPLQSRFTGECPPEGVRAMSNIMSLICLADAQAVVIKKSEANSASSGVLSKLHFGITQMLDEAHSLLRSNARYFNDVSSNSRLLEFLISCSFLHQLRSQRYFANDIRTRHRNGGVDGEFGVAVAVLRNAVAGLKNTRPPKDPNWRRVFHEEASFASELLERFEHENVLVYREKIVDYGDIPFLEGRKIVDTIPHKPQRFEREFDFQA